VSGWDHLRHVWGAWLTPGPRDHRLQSDIKNESASRMAFLVMLDPVTVFALVTQILQRFQQAVHLFALVQAEEGSSNT